MHHDRRHYNRQNCQMPINYSEYCQTNYFQATMHDKSEGGVSFTAGAEIPSGLPVCILFPTNSGNPKSTTKSQAVVARVKWRQRDSQAGAYKIGAQLMFQGYMRPIEKASENASVCELCGKKLNEEVYMTDEPLNFCLNCFKYLGGVLEDNTRQSVIQLLLGNVM